MRNYDNYALGKWIKGDGEGAPLFNAITGEEEMYTTTKQNEIKNSWDIVDEVKNIREKQKKNINNMSQSSSYGI